MPVVVRIADWRSSKEPAPAAAVREPLARSAVTLLLPVDELPSKTMRHPTSPASAPPSVLLLSGRNESAGPRLTPALLAKVMLPPLLPASAKKSWRSDPVPPVRF